jgi:hypothetical protein
MTASPVGSTRTISNCGRAASSSEEGSAGFAGAFEATSAGGPALAGPADVGALEPAGAVEAAGGALFEATGAALSKCAGATLWRSGLW